MLQDRQTHGLPHTLLLRNLLLKKPSRYTPKFLCYFGA